MISKDQLIDILLSGACDNEKSGRFDITDEPLTEQLAAKFGVNEGRDVIEFSGDWFYRDASSVKDGMRFIYVYGDTLRFPASPSCHLSLPLQPEITIHIPADREAGETTATFICLYLIEN